MLDFEIIPMYTIHMQTKYISSHDILILNVQ